jgi:BMFP domain-containing protein YqiC
MQTQSALLDEAAKMMTMAVGLAQAAGQEAKTFLRAQGDRLAQEIDLVNREEFEAMRELAMEASARVAALEQRVAALEGRTGGPAGANDPSI